MTERGAVMDSFGFHVQLEAISVWPLASWPMSGLGKTVEGGGGSKSEGWK